MTAMSAAAVMAATSSGTNLPPYIAVLICSRAWAYPVIPDNSLRVYNERARACIRNTRIKIPPGLLSTAFVVRAEIPVRLYLDLVSAKFDCAIEAFYGFTCRGSL